MSALGPGEGVKLFMRGGGVGIGMEPGVLGGGKGEGGRCGYGGGERHFREGGGEFAEGKGGYWHLRL